MARIRSIKPTFFVNEELAALPFQWRLLFAGLWTQADREGRLEDRPMRLKAALFPYDHLNIDDGLGCLVNAGLIIRYERDGMKLIAIPRWAKHQQPHIREAVSELPPPSASTGLALFEPIGSGKGADQERIREGVQVGAVLDRFERFWSEYPRKVAKDAARKEWLKRSPSDELTELMLAKVREQAQSDQWTKDGGQFIPHARTWLHQARWEDEGLDRRSGGDRRAAQFYKPWKCPHEVECGNAGACEKATFLNRPLKKAAAS